MDNQPRAALRTNTFDGTLANLQLLLSQQLSRTLNWWEFLNNFEFMKNFSIPECSQSSPLNKLLFDPSSTTRVLMREPIRPKFCIHSHPLPWQVLSQQTNPGIKYEYLLPTSLATSEEGSDVDYFSSAEDNLPLNYKLKAANAQLNNTTGRKKRKFAWKVVGFTPCSKSCGGGSQQPVIRCVKGEPIRAYAPKRCAHMKKPSVNENLMKCNSQPCPAFWKLGDWTGCRCGEFDEKTNQTREVKCVQELISGVVIQVNSGACIDDRPVTSAQCECVRPTRVAKIESHKQSRQPSIIHSNTQSDQKTANKHRTKPPKNKKSGSWLLSEW